MANEAQSIPRVVLEATKNYSSPNQIKELDLSFKDLKEYTFLPNYKNLVSESDPGRHKHLRQRLGTHS